MDESAPARPTPDAGRVGWGVVDTRFLAPFVLCLLLSCADEEEPEELIRGRPYSEWDTAPVPPKHPTGRRFARISSPLYRCGRSLRIHSGTPSRVLGTAPYPLLPPTTVPRSGYNADPCFVAPAPGTIPKTLLSALAVASGSRPSAGAAADPTRPTARSATVAVARSTKWPRPALLRRSPHLAVTLPDTSRTRS